ncbi:MAG: hypothetical protein RL427_1352 [Bacteroidota bacterium]|jgi:hypothetical protein
MGMELKTGNFSFKNSILWPKKADDLCCFEGNPVRKIG